MTRHSLSLRLGTGAALTLVAILALVVADAREFTDGSSRATSAFTRRAHGFMIRGDLKGGLAPGVSHPLNLRLTNPYRFSLELERLMVAVSVDAEHAAGCRVSRNFKVTRLAKRAYPIRLRPRRTRTLRALRVKRLPRVAMRNLPTNQDACKGAQLEFRYAGRARRWRQGHAR